MHAAANCEQIVNLCIKYTRLHVIRCTKTNNLYKIYAVLEKVRHLGATRRLSSVPAVLRAYITGQFAHPPYVSATG